MRKYHYEWKSYSLLITPAVIFVIILQFYPLAYSFYLSFQEWSLTSSQTPQGFNNFKNYGDILNDEVFHRAVSNSVIITSVSVFFQMIFGVGLAYLTIGSSWQLRLVRTILIIPMVIAPVAAGTLWRMLLNSRSGLFNYILNEFGVIGPQWLSSQNWAIISVILLDIWQATPFVLLVALAGISSIPQEFKESASIDGANKFQSFIKIDIPILTPLLLIVFLFRFMDSLLNMDSVYSLTFGGPGYGTYTLTFYIYTLGLRNFNFGDASAASWIFMFFSIIFIAIIFVLHKRTEV